MARTRFSELTEPFRIAKKKVAGMPADDVQAFRHTAFNLFAANLLDWFETFPTLNTVRLVHKLTHDVSSGLNTTIEGQHELYVYALEAGLDPDADMEANAAYLREAIPFTLMGNGTFEITREDARVQRFLALRDTQANEWTGLIASISDSLDRAFGTVRTVHSLI